MLEFRRTGIVTLTAALGLAACTAGNSGDVEFNEEVRSELVWMAETDASLRERVVRAETPDMEDMRKLQEGEIEQSARLREILEEHGWPGADMVGKDGALAAWTLLKHGDVELKELGINLIEESAEPGVALSEIATMTDVVLVGQERPQLYGTQFTMVHGKLIQEPVDNRDSVAVRRARVGMPPLDEYVQLLQQNHGMDVQLADPHGGMIVMPADSSSGEEQGH
jgi:hypothetical protein